MTSVSILFSEYRRRVLGLLLLHPENRYHVREIARITGTTAGTLHRELLKLAQAQVLTREQNGNQVYYQANKNHIIFDELVSILKKTSGMSEVLREALMPFSEQLDLVCIFGSVAKGTENIASDIDLLIIGDLDFTEAVTALYSAQEILRREINPKIYSKEEWKKRIIEKDFFVRELLSGQKIFIIGDVNGLG